jgi:hypothetical protein
MLSSLWSAIAKIVDNLKEDLTVAKLVFYLVVKQLGIEKHSGRTSPSIRLLKI